MNLKPFSKKQKGNLQELINAYSYSCSQSADELRAALKGKKSGVFMPAIGRLLVNEWEETEESKALASKLQEILKNQHHSGGSFMVTLQMFLHRLNERAMTFKMLLNNIPNGKRVTRIK